MTYQVEWREVGSETLTGTASGVATLYYDATGLVPSTNYEWRVRETDGVWAAWLSFTTAEFLLTAGGIGAHGEIASGAITQTHILVTDGLAGAAEIDRPALSQSLTLTAGGIDAHGELGTAALTQTHTLATLGIEAHGVLDRPALLGAVTELTTGGIDAHADIDTGALVQHHILATGGISAEAALDTAALIQTHALAARELSAWANLERGSLVQTHTLAALDIEAFGVLESGYILTHRRACANRTYLIPAEDRRYTVGAC